MEPPEGVTEFQSSQLGTKEHHLVIIQFKDVCPHESSWDDAYVRELENFKEHGDPGEVWFGESCLETLLDWLDERADEIDGLKESSVLDIGCGNGYTLIELARRGWTSLHGSDYSAPAVQLAKDIAEKDELEIEYYVDDILNSKVTTTYRVCTHFFDARLLLDKGTFDAIALNSDKSFRSRYVIAVRALAAPDSILVITSCNFTRPELRQIFSEGGHWKSWKFVEYPTISFGGQEGSAVSTVAFKPV